jgi:hypothetical protein
VGETLEGEKRRERERGERERNINFFCCLNMPKIFTLVVRREAPNP